MGPGLGFQKKKETKSDGQLAHYGSLGRDPWFSPKGWLQNLSGSGLVWGASTATRVFLRWRWDSRVLLLPAVVGGVTGL